MSRLHTKERVALEAYLVQIGETDQALIDDFWCQCQSDPEALSFWLKEAAKELAEQHKRQKEVDALQGYDYPS